MLRSGISLSALVCAFILYALPPGEPPALKRTGAFVSVLESQSVRRIRGRALFDLRLSASGRAYTLHFEALLVQGALTGGGELGEFGASGRGILSVPKELLEGLMPGGLQSRGRGAGSFAPERGMVFEADIEAVSQGGEAYPVFFGGSLEPVSRGGWIREQRARARLFFRRLLYSWDDAGGLLLALFAGLPDALDRELLTSFRQAGLSHVIALSGMHLSLCAGLAGVLAGRLGIRSSVLVSLILCFAFVWFAGASPSLVRALISLCISQCVRLMGRRLRSIQLLSLSFLIHVLCFPSDAGGAAFMLSYAAMLGIAAAGRLFTRLLSALLPLFLARALAISASAQLFCLPVSLFVFGSAAPIGIVSSLLVSPLIALFMAGGIVLVAVSALYPPLSAPCSIPCRLLYEFIVCISRLCAAVPQIGPL